ncbi:AzlC family ABC transporter permease [Caproiciproducens galactitolivorans]|uniref:Inner membrane protein YgaZ n=1 Tax=Caproiciproducens galactitolivorans TaxID=642589 RepID=A0A4Z0YDD9_9FIRM|nr:AzlC family ABC transporter permease [Caproiciproducens galactitolivorans]QEY34683.1 AzlC family ABC transporter permease [Caproiciproducens galactitolivorans]TGJ75846.1 inner membrane protein YgaZ [Caproiciproducens galactitolivorans]
MQQNETLTFQKGLKDGLPICLGYISVSFAFGMMATQGGLPVWVALLISMTNLTSAGQFAGTQLILTGGLYIEIAVTTFVINIRYMLMSLSLSQKVDETMTSLQRFVLSFGVTDEVFAVAMQQKGNINARYFSGLIAAPYAGWTLGTFLGAAATGLLPGCVRTALGIAIYGMFIAIIIPPAKKAKPIAKVILFTIVLSCIFKWAPYLNRISSGWVIIVCAVIASAFAALRYPVHEAEVQE